MSRDVSILLRVTLNSRLSILWKLAIVTLLLLLVHLSTDDFAAQYLEATYRWPNGPSLPSHLLLSKGVYNKFDYSSHVISYNPILSHAK